MVYPPCAPRALVLPPPVTFGTSLGLVGAVVVSVSTLVLVTFFFVGAMELLSHSIPMDYANG